MTDGTQRNCLVCCTDSMHPAKKYAGLLKCDVCGFITADVRITEEEAEELYGKDYFHGQEYSDYTRDKYILQKNFSNRLKTLNNFMTDIHHDLLEIGCAYGFFLDLSKAGFRTVKGIDISGDAVDYARNTFNADARAGNFLDMEVNSYDVCCMWDTIEHLSEPDKFISKISKEISPGGIVAITTGDIGSLNAKLRRKNWRQIHPPTHLHYFSAKTLEKLLDRYSFKTLHVSHPGNLINIETALYTILCLKRNKVKLYDCLIKIFRKIRIAQINIPINFYDFMYIIARKK